METRPAPDRELLVESPWFSVVRDTVTSADGVATTHHLVLAPDAVSVVAVDDGGHVVLTRQAIYTGGEDRWRLPSGGVDPGDDHALAAAQRELADETGLHAQRWSSLGTLGSTEVVARTEHLFLADSLTAGTQRLEGGEADLRVERVPLVEAIDWAMEGVITHGPSAVALLRMGMRLHRGGQ